MFATKRDETSGLFLLRWTARVLSAASIGILLLFMFGEAVDVSAITWKEMAGIMLFPLGLIAGLILGWQEEWKGGALAVFCIVAFFFVYGYVLDGRIEKIWWFLAFAFPGVLFILYGILAPPAKQKLGPEEDPTA
jgi:hypothetical protein